MLNWTLTPKWQQKDEKVHSPSASNLEETEYAARRTQNESRYPVDKDI